MAVDDGTHPVAAGNKPLPLQGGQDIPQLGAADAKLLRQEALPGQTLTGCVGALLHRGKDLRPDGFGFSGLTAHVLHLNNR